MNQKGLMFLWGGLLGMMITIFLVNNWIKSQLDESSLAGQQSPQSAVAATVKSPAPLAVTVEQGEHNTSATINPPDSAQPDALAHREEVVDEKIVYETPLIDSNLPQ